MFCELFQINKTKKITKNKGEDFIQIYTQLHPAECKAGQRPLRRVVSVDKLFYGKKILFHEHTSKTSTYSIPRRHIWVCFVVRQKYKYCSVFHLDTYTLDPSSHSHSLSPISSVFHLGILIVPKQLFTFIESDFSCDPLEHTHWT